MRWPVRVVRELDQGQITRHTATHAVAVAMLVALVGLGMAIYLIGSRYTSIERRKRPGDLE